ncbi:MAG: adenylate/guanylate cyclase domain-containing protein [Armatimonadetes bacterium]|nr:adenylate/guanylate cyclase domain-containing protein [Armatimonadota bacterium]
MKLRLLIPAIATALSLLLVLVLQGVEMGGFQLVTVWENAAFDARMEWAGKRQPDPRIWLAGIDEESFRTAFGREFHAQALRNLARHGAAVVFFDLLFDEPRAPEVDEDLARAAAGTEIAVLAGAVTLGKGDVPIPPRLIPQLEEVVDQGRGALGLINNDPDDVDQITRWAFLAIGARREGWPPKPIPSAALAIFARTNHLDPRDIEYRADTVIAFPSVIPAQVRQDEEDTVSQDEDDTVYYKFPIAFHPPATGPDRCAEGGFPVVPYHRLMNPEDPILAQLEGAIVVVGENTASSDDVIGTPVGRMKGFECHAQILNTLLAGTFIRSVPTWWNRLVLVGLVVFGAWTVWTQATPLRAVAVTAAILAGYLGCNLAIFVGFHYCFELIPPLVGVFLAAVCAVVSRFVITHGYLARYIPQEAVDELLTSGTVMAHNVVATVIVTDIRGYTSLSETRTPAEMLTLLNEYHEITVEIYDRHGGRVLTYQGDAQIIVFGAPRKLKDAVAAAANAARDMQEAVNVLRRRWGIQDRASFDVGAGICTGPVSIGEVGSRKRAEYTVIGETVRLAHKVQSQSQVLDSPVLLDEASIRAAKSPLETKPIPGVLLEGRTEPVNLYRLIPEEDREIEGLPPDLTRKKR